MGQIFAFSAIIFEGFQSPRKATLPKYANQPAHLGGLIGILGGAVLVIAIALQQFINLRSVSD